MTEVLLSSEDLTVLGGPQTVSVDIDFGPTGERGSKFFVGNGNPNSNSTQIPVTPKIYDMYINLLTSDPDNEYLYIYQYQTGTPSSSWAPLVKLIPNTYSSNRVVTFIGGEKQINVPISKIVSPSLISTVTAANFNVQYSIAGNTNPVSSTVSVQTIVTESGTGNLILPIVIKAIEHSSGTWVDLAKEVTVHLLITVV
ncbi:MAG: hypothetical protein WCI60_04370 [bacterium]